MKERLRWVSNEVRSTPTVLGVNTCVLMRRFSEAMESIDEIAYDYGLHSDVVEDGLRYELRRLRARVSEQPTKEEFSRLAGRGK